MSSCVPVGGGKKDPRDPPEPPSRTRTIKDTLLRSLKPHLPDPCSCCPSPEPSGLSGVVDEFSEQVQLCVKPAPEFHPVHHPPRLPSPKTSPLDPHPPCAPSVQGRESHWRRSLCLSVRPMRSSPLGDTLEFLLLEDSLIPPSTASPNHRRFIPYPRPKHP